MLVNYIYNGNGQIEYAVVPYDIWKNVKSLAQNAENKAKTENKSFDPTSYIGMLSHYKFDIETELSELRSEWKDDIL